ncbi:MAG: PEP-CTERM sorting domain-containing protein [Phycisphaerae bacterium]
MRSSQTGSSYATQRIVQTPNDGSVVVDSWDTYQLGMSTSEFYYRVTMAPMLIDPDGVFTNQQNQWGRTGGPGAGTESFRARFFLVPEPSVAVLLAAGLAGLALVRRRRA